MTSDDFTGNIVRPFQLESSNLRGRVVRFNSVLDDIIGAHDYPEVVSQLLAETVTLCSLLSSMLKYEGIFTLQTQGDGPISMLVADMTSEGHMRGYARFDEARVDAVTKQLATFSHDVDEGSDNHLAQLLGKGYLAFTVDQKLKVETYQGIVELQGNSIVDCVQHYFSQSEQINTGIKLAVGKRDGYWRSGGLMLQQMPEEDVGKVSNFDEDDWRRSMILLQSCTEKELLDPDLNSHIILTRLFHEEGVWVFEPTPLIQQCRCSLDKVDNVLKGLRKEELLEFVVDGKIEMNCEFCNHTYYIDPKKYDA